MTFGFVDEHRGIWPVRMMWRVPACRPAGTEVVWEIWTRAMSGRSAQYRHCRREREERHDQTTALEHSPTFKTRVALAAIVGEKTLAALAERLYVLMLTEGVCKQTPIG